MKIGLPLVGTAYSVLAVCFFTGSVALGLLWLGSAGLSVDAAPMPIVFSVCVVGCVAWAIGLFFALSRFFFPTISGLCAAPFTQAVLAANLALRLS